jgi:hypothetical protein
MKRRPKVQSSNATIAYKREEPYGVVGAQVLYEITADFMENMFYSIARVVRHDPVFDSKTTLAEKDWPFSSTEMNEIEIRLAEVPRPWIDPDPPEDNDDDR